MNVSNTLPLLGITELKRVAKQYGISGVSKYTSGNKAELVAIIKRHLSRPIPPPRPPTPPPPPPPSRFNQGGIPPRSGRRGMVPHFTYSPEPQPPCVVVPPPCVVVPPPCVVDSPPPPSIPLPVPPLPVPPLPVPLPVSPPASSSPRKIMSKLAEVLVELKTSDKVIIQHYKPILNNYQRYQAYTKQIILSSICDTLIKKTSVQSINNYIRTLDLNIVDINPTNSVIPLDENLFSPYIVYFNDYSGFDMKFERNLLLLEPIPYLLETMLYIFQYRKISIVPNSEKDQIVYSPISSTFPLGVLDLIEKYIAEYSKYDRLVAITRTYISILTDPKFHAKLFLPAIIKHLVKSIKSIPSPPSVPIRSAVPPSIPRFIPPAPLPVPPAVVPYFGEVSEDSKLSIIQLEQGIIEHENDVITPEFVLNLLDSRAFVEKIRISLTKLRNVKYEKYNILKINLENSIKEDEDTASELGLSSSDKEKMFPLLISNKIYLKKVKSLIAISITPIENLKENLIVAITDKDYGIMSLTGKARDFIKNSLAKTIFILSKGPEKFIDSFSNMIFTGPPGVGKTKLAKSIGFILGKIGILLTDNLIITSPKDLVAGYVGQTGPRTSGVLMKGFESVILIDEAYQIMNCVNGELDERNGFGSESITEIVNFLDKYIGMSIVIVAGYAKDIKNCFLGANQGLERRFPVRWELPLYSAYELFVIFMNEVIKKLNKNIFDEEIALYILSVFKKIYDKGYFKNQAGDSINLVSIFIESYYSSISHDWNESFVDKKEIVKHAFNDFLKEFKIRIEN